MKLFFVFALLVFSLSAHAKRSQEERAELSYELAAMIGDDYKLPGGGVSVSKYINADNLIGLKAFQGKKGGEGTFFDNPESQTVFALNYKHFFGNTFYLSSGLYYLNYTEEHYSSNLHLTDIGAEIRIGNQWQWSHFSIGVDWLGLGHGLVYFKKQYTDNSDKFTRTGINLYLAYSF